MVPYYYEKYISRYNFYAYGNTNFAWLKKIAYKRICRRKIFLQEICMIAISTMNDGQLLSRKIVSTSR